MAQITSIASLYPAVYIDQKTKIVDIWNSYQLTEEFSNKTNIFKYHRVVAGDRWDKLAELYYNDRNLWWVLALYNNVDDPFALFFDLTIKDATRTLAIMDPQYIQTILINSSRQNYNLNITQAYI